MMICPKCNKKMVKGTTTFMGTPGLTPMICSFTTDEEKKKSLLVKNEITKMMMQGLELDAYYCEDCKIVMPVIE